MSSRIIKKHQNNTSALQLTNCLSSLVELELLYPSREMFLTSPWLTDIPLIHNEYGQFRALTAAGIQRVLGLREVLILLSERGCRVHIVTGPSEHNRSFLTGMPSSIEIKKDQVGHEKGWLTGKFYLRGSMNFTYNGININSESVEITTDESLVSMAMIEARHYWEII